ncbi:MFS transporter [Undibacterium pigrum]|uniref:DHA1 family inner membrane transport protein n=1 Tax=Undibacterium pigrum TaxID=401470 RepID=A0A318J495_9BURK|nr:MFS transporter [Undibacterium pigrum]PXX41934.1 DHA1 family inner membrane transport protein [Undibacterium pigrum]
MSNTISTAAASAAAASATQSIKSSEHTQRRFLYAVTALGLGAFAIGTGEFAMMGLLPEVAQDLAVSIPEAGHVVSAYAFGVVIGAPMFAVLTASWPRRTLLIALILLFAAGNFAGTLTSDFLSLNIVRFIAGLPHGAYFGVATLLAANMVAPHKRATAVGLVILGLTSSTLLGVPAATWLGQTWGWQAAYFFVASLAVISSVAVYFAVPDVPATNNANPRSELSALANKQVWLTLGIGAVGFGGMFAVFSYIKPILTEVTHMSAGVIPLILSLFGVGMVVGSMLGARLADKNLLRSIAVLLLWNAVVLGGVSFVMSYTVSAIIWVFLLGTLVAIGPALQIRLMDVAGDAQTLAAALNHSAFNVANALGAWLGGVVITIGYGWTSTGWLGALLALGGLAVFGLSVKK